MTPTTSWPRLKLILSEGDYHKLIRTEFQLNQDTKPLITTRRSGTKNSISWSRAVQALTIFLVQYVGWSKKYRPEDFEMRGNRKSPTATLDMTLGKGRGRDQVNIKWQESMFGRNEKASHSYLNRYIDRTNPDQKRECEPFGLKILTSQLPPANIRIFVGEKELKEFPELKALSDKLCGGWTGKQNLPLWTTYETDPKENVIVAKPIQRTDSKKAEPPAEPMAAKPLAELFKSLPVASIISHIIPALLPAQGQNAIDKYLAEILSPECINVLAEKLTNESIDDFCNFYYGNFNDEGKIRNCVAAAIASNREMRNRLAAKVADCGYQDMMSWFHSFSFHCAREIVNDVERALNAIAEEPGFKEKFLLYAPSRLPALIKHFSNYGCVVAVGILEKINQEGREEEVRVDRILNAARHADSP